MSEAIQKVKSASVAVPAGAKSASVLARLAKRFGVDEGKMLECLKATAFRGQVSNEQMMSLCVVADQYGLNPWTKEIYAFPDKNNGIVPVVGVDGWSRIINEHPQFDGVETADSEDGKSCKCTIHRKDRAHPTSVTEYMEECFLKTSPWESHPRRMLRHKALIQCARIAFGYAGIYDQDEAERIVEGVEIGPARAPVAMPRAIEAHATDAQTAPEAAESTTPPTSPAKMTHDELVAAITPLYDKASLKKTGQVFTACGIAWTDGAEWFMAEDEKLVAALSMFKC